MELGTVTRKRDISRVLKDEGPLLGWKGFRQRKQHLPRKGVVKESSIFRDSKSLMLPDIREGW